MQIASRIGQAGTWLRRVYLAAAVLSLVTASVMAQSPERVQIALERSLRSLPIQYQNGFKFASVQALADALDLRTYYSEKARKIILYVGGKEIKVTAQNPFVMIADRVVQLPIETRYDGGDILVPLPYFLDAVRSVLPEEFAGIVEQGEAAASGNGDGEPADPSAPNIHGYVIETKANGTLIRISTSRRFASSELSTRVTKDWLHLDVLGGRLDPSLRKQKVKKGLVREFRPLQAETMAHLSFRLRKKITDRKAFYNPATREIWISLPSDKIDRKRIEKALESERKRWRIDTVVIDPGHGGRDPGAIGPRGIREKDVVLKIARHLKRLLEKRSDIRVVMTRESDTFVPLQERAAIANREQGKLFISLHANSNRSPRVAGATTYFLGPAKTEEALEVAARENAAIHYEGSRSAYAEMTNEKFILLAMAQNSFNHESENLAAIVQEELTRRLGLRDRGVKQAGYYVLVGASMPNILVETAFISNRREEKLLAASSFQKKAAEALYQSILRFKERYDWGL
jgi:N-acetylmuramoyl-L-alanine amidase